jgi:ABC-type amino acid transport substrate-binding protein
MGKNMRVANVLLLFLLLTLAAAGVSAEPASTLERIRASGVVRLGFLESAPPFSYAENGKPPQGYSIDLCNGVVEGIGKQLRLPNLRREWVKVTFQDRLAAVKEGRVDLDCGTTTWTLSRQEGVDFSLMTFIDGGSLLVRAADPLARLTDFAGKSIAVVPGTTTADALPRELKLRGVAARIVPVADERKGMALLAAREVDAYASDRLLLLGLALDEKGQQAYKLIDEDYSIEPYALAMRRDDHDFRLAVNRSLARIYRTKEIVRIYDIWLGYLGRPGVVLSSMYLLQAIPE